MIREVRHFRDLIVELTIAFRIPTKPALQRYTVMMGVDTNWGRESKGPIDRQQNTDLILSNGQKLRERERERALFYENLHVNLPPFVIEIFLIVHFHSKRKWEEEWSTEGN